MARRLFYADQVRAGQALIFGETAQHIRKVLRAAPGQVYEISDGTGLWLGRLAGYGKDQAQFDLVEQLQPSKPPAQVHLLAALIKFDRFEWMLEKAAELGAARISPVWSIRSEPGLERGAEKRRGRWEKILREAGQQCRLLRPPELGVVAGLAEALRAAAAVRLWLEEERAAPPILSELRDEPGGVALLAGPEGGWDDRERAMARAEGWRSVSLGPQVLRAETAALAALAVVMAECDRRGRAESKSPGF